MLGKVVAQALPVVSRQLCLRLETGNRIEVELQEGVTALKILQSEHT